MRSNVKKVAFDFFKSRRIVFTFLLVVPLSSHSLQFSSTTCRRLKGLDDKIFFQISKHLSIEGHREGAREQNETHQ